ncbi:Microcin J25 export ATP-binding/permease protein mcjD [Brucella canis ATCC 23365]|uniref:Microcin J25 export ATP-binding/permease protein mcjD n=1 Tax=Brucella canis (strain ATCC 23365 / NCTC 10854 / RM-666) TaxID=483179 RepID=A9ME25_BRUC2|nr:ABC transporter ATP-binding protein/permease [Brucella melitensis]ABX63463.1 Microcin J25 export ATP-binding/permease protein mcjD [Brucella canis ATCC 23365]AIJ84360.1 ABC transporter family protein [Brucella canis]
MNNERQISQQALQARERSAVSRMTSFWGLLRAYWVSDRWKEAWALTAAIFLITAFISKTTVWVAEASGHLMNSIVNVNTAPVQSPLAAVVTNAGVLIILILAKDVLLVGFRHLLSTTLHRKWRQWLNDSFSDALLDRNHTHFHLQQGNGAHLPDNVDQRVQESIKGMTGGAIGLVMGIVGVVLSAFFVGQKLLEISTEVHGLEFLGSYGGALLALAVILLYVPLGTLIAIKIGKRLERLNLGMQKAEGSYRGEWTTFLRRSFQISASEGENVQRTVNNRLYREVDGTWDKLNRFDAAYLAFSQAYGFLSLRIVAYIPGFLPYMSGAVNFRNYVTGAELVAAMINDCSWFIQVMPAIANLRANAGRVIGLAQSIESVQEPAEFYARSGVNRFAFTHQHPRFGLSVRNLTLMQGPASETPFLRSGVINMRAGDWIYMRGESCSGKTSFIKALNGLWPYGTGNIIYPQGANSLYVPQEAKFPSVSLKQLVALPRDEGDFNDLAVAAVLHEAGLGEFIERMKDADAGNSPWDMVLSSGQKQKVMLARILLHKPSIIFLDEATGALDPASKLRFHTALKTRCPDAIVVSIMHEEKLPTLESGESIFSHVLDIANGYVSLIPAHFAAAPDAEPAVSLIAAE